jgi:hypothetical protein
MAIGLLFAREAQGRFVAGRQPIDLPLNPSSAKYATFHSPLAM